MPEITDAQFREYGQYSALGTPEEVGKKVRDLDKVKSEAAERRQKLTDAEKKIADLEAKMPEGSKILTGDAAKAYETIEAAGGPAEVTKKLARVGELEKEVAKAARKDAIRATAKAEGWPEDVAEKALERDAEFAALTLETRDEERETVSGGKTEKRKVAVGYGVSADGKSISIPDWVKNNADHLLLTLTSGGTAPNGSGREMEPSRGRADANTSNLSAKDRAKAAINAGVGKGNALRSPVANTTNP